MHISYIDKKKPYSISRSEMSMNNNWTIKYIVYKALLSNTDPHKNKLAILRSEILGL